jgi:hypothetical protein
MATSTPTIVIQVTTTRIIPKVIDPKKTVPTAESLRAAATQAVTEWMTAKLAQDNLPRNASMERSNAANWKQYNALCKAIEAIRRTAWAGNPYQPTEMELAELTPFYSVVIDNIDYIVITEKEVNRQFRGDGGDATNETILMIPARGV